MGLGSREGNSFDGDLFFGRAGIDYLLSPNFLIGVFGGYDKGEADFTSFRIDLDSKGLIAGGYFGLKMTPSMTGLPVNLILDGQVSHGWLDYDIVDNDAGVVADFNSDRFAGSVNLTAVILQPTTYGRPIRWLPKIGVNYMNEKQEAYSDSAGTAVAGQAITLGQLTFGTQVFLPVAEGMEFFTRIEGQWDFNDVGLITTDTGSTYSPDDFGAVVGAGIRATVSDNVTLKLEGAAEGLGRNDYDQYSGSVRVDIRF